MACIAWRREPAVNDDRPARPDKWATWTIPSGLSDARGLGSTEQSFSVPELVRPYFRSGGRTDPELSLPLDALVSATARGRESANWSGSEHRAICELCLQTRSVAEIAGCLRVPVGVAQVLIADAYRMNLVRVHASPEMDDGRPGLELLERVLNGLQAI